MNYKFKSRDARKSRNTSMYSITEHYFNFDVKPVINEVLKFYGAFTFKGLSSIINISTYPQLWDLSSTLLFYPEDSLVIGDKQKEEYYLNSELNTNSYVTSQKNLNMENTTQHPDIFNSNFRDKFISDYHQHIATHKLESFSDNSSRLISKETYEYLASVCNIKYDLSIFNQDLKGFEGFIDKHTYISCSYLPKESAYYLNTIFSYATSSKVILDNIVFVEKPASVSWVTGVNSDGSLEIENLPIEPPKPVFDSFYPWLDGVTLDDFLENYYKSEESILLLYGSPGTGKSNLLKHFLHKYNESALITYQDDIRDLDKMFSSFLKGEEKFLIIEDADEFLIKRENGNTSMKRLLNIADGLTSNKDKKVIFTTNLTSINSIDAALVRPGRCYGTVKFENLNKQQALAVANDLQIAAEIVVKDNYSLAELFAIKNNKLKIIGQGSNTGQFGF